jgi:putative ABC transport system permease protein
VSLRDLVFAGRTLRKSPIFTLAAALTIALGVGASTAIFSVTNAVLLRPLPYQDPNRLVIAISDLRNRDVHDFPFSNANFIDLRDGTKGAFQDFAGVFTFRDIVHRLDGTPEQIRIANVTTNFFRLVGAKIAFGRDFTDADGIPQPPGAPGNAIITAPPQPPLPTIAILSYEYFQRRYSANPAALGQGLSTDAQFSPQIVGVLAPRFQLYFPPAANVETTPDVWIANRIDYDAAHRNAVSIHAVGKLKDGVSLEQAQSAVDTVAAETRKNFPIQRTAGYFIRVEPMRQHLVSEVRPAILALMGAVIFLLLIAYANVANLLIVRASLRERELAVRAAIGATWWHLVRQMLTEAFLLVSVGALVGLGLAWLGIHELLVIAPANLPRLDTIRIDSVVLASTALAGLLAAAIFGAASAWRASRPDVIAALRGGGRNEGHAGSAISRKVVVVAEVALSYVLLIGSGLMFRSFLELQRIDPGFDPRALLTFQVLGIPDSYTPQQLAAITHQIQATLRAIPGIQNVAASYPFPLTGGFSPIRWGTGEALVDASKFQAVDYEGVLPSYFDVMRTPVLAGRTFSDADNAPGRKVVVIDQFLADKAFPHESAVGKRILFRIDTPEPEWFDVIGVVAHQREESLAEPGREQVYFTDGFMGYGWVQQWVVRTGGDPASYGSEIRAAIKSLDSHLLIAEMQPVESLVRQAQAGTRFSLLLIGVFAVIAGLLAGVGLYGVLSTVVRQRTAEIGIRMALGARPATIFRLVIGQGLRLTAIGIAAGLFAAFALTRTMTTMLVGIKATDPTTFAAMAVAFFLIAAAASGLPARRAASLDPAAALRAE